MFIDGLSRLDISDYKIYVGTGGGMTYVGIYYH